ncbi:CtrA inhibitor SciP [Anianabacter salinae]|uniref:CtrA inhibitor SciP n=1 Tax=Anianabacter salinae TaxID=2851023 RepID=UPI00225E2182|nr:DUF1153 domain-containing protein [Anianabacter salinae]MBV0911922.1 DUF1153 domain-containing protein [Anianabacter salinae]
MYLRKSPGPRLVTLPDGTTMTRADLPPADTRRWVARRKSAVVRAVDAGLISEDEALSLYDLSAEEFGMWRKGYTEFGEAALKTTLTQKYRQP